MSPPVALPKQESASMSVAHEDIRGLGCLPSGDMLMTECHAEFALPLAIELASMV